MSVDLGGDRAARGTALRGAAVGLLLAAALLAPALLSGGVPARGDLADFFWPMKAYTAERWAEGAIPLWNPLSGGGEPWLAQLQSGALYPGDLPFLLGWREGALLGIALHLALAAAGAAFWVWSLGGSRPASLLAAGLFAGGGAFLSLVPVYNNACTAAWLPWLFACARRVVVGRSRGAGFGVAVAGAFLAGEPALAAAGTAGALLLALFAGAEGEAPEAEEPRGRIAVRVALPVLAGLCVAGAALLPFAGLLRSSERVERTTREESLARPVGSSDLADLVAAPRAEATRVPAPDRGGYLVTLALGPLAFLLVAGAGAGLPGRRRLLAGLGVLGAGGFLLALGASGLLAPLLHDAGLLRGVRFPARWLVFSHLALAVAAGAGLDGWLWGSFRPATPPGHDEPGDPVRAETRARRSAALLALAAGLAVLAGLSALLLLDPGIRASRDPARTLLGLGAAVAGAAVLLTARLRAASPSPRAGGLLAALALLPLPWLAGEPLAPVPAAAVRAGHPLLSGTPRGPEAGRVFAPAGQDRSLALRWRYAGSPAWSEASVARAGTALAGYTNLFHGVATTGSASPLGSPRPERLVGAALAGGDAASILALVDVRQVLSPFPPRIPGLRLSGEKGGVRLYEAPGAFGRSYFPAGTRIATDDEAYEALRRPGFDPGRVALVAPPPPGTSLPPPRPAGAWAAARFVADEPERAELTTSASVASLLVLTRSWDPGWEARVDGERVAVLRAQLALVAVVVPPGEHRIELAYRPLSFRIGLALSGAGLLALLALALAAPPGERRP
jgi:hypothetical protein